MTSRLNTFQDSLLFEAEEEYRFNKLFLISLQAFGGNIGTDLIARVELTADGFEKYNTGGHKKVS